MLRTKLSAVVLAIAFTGAMTGASIAASGWAKSGVNVRSGPGSNYDVVGWAEKCTHLDLGQKQGSWWRVSWSGGQGWVSGSYITQQKSYCGGY
jgi:N-acetylmuramoyl-L-alanine amidase